MQRISSANNPIIKEVKSLKERKYRYEKDLYIIEGKKLLEEALTCEAGIRYVIINESLFGTTEVDSPGNNNIAGNIKIYFIPDKLFREISDTVNPQGVMAVVEMNYYKLTDASFPENTLWVIADGIQDPGNLGTIIRTADAAGVSGVVAANGCTDPFSPKVIRSTMGSIFRIPLYFSDNISILLAYIKEKGVRTYASHLKGHCVYYNADMKGKIALVIGNESSGISEDAVRYSDLLVKIPMPGKAESLNAASAAAILIYEAVRQRLC